MPETMTVLSRRIQKSSQSIIAFSREITYLWLTLLLCSSKQKAFVQNRATDEMYSSPAYFLCNFLRLHGRRQAYLLTI